MYLDYWRFKQFPFENISDPDFFYLSKTHEEALTRLIYAAERRKGGAMLTGEIGCGKTTLSRIYINQLSEDKYDISLIINPKLDPTDFLQEVLYQFGIENLPNKKIECLRILNDRMLENMKNSKETLLIVDEAQLINESTFEEIRLLLNFQLNNRFLLTIVLLGQPELRQKVNNIEQLDQRIAIRYHLRPFDLEETFEYINFRLQRAGNVTEYLFDHATIEKIYEYTNGVPRKINSLCDLALLIGFSNRETVIDPETIEKIIKDGSFA